MELITTKIHFNLNVEDVAHFECNAYKATNMGIKETVFMQPFVLSGSLG
jgi:hypothetical protein